jgi:small-conductance mechanosensitive channel
LLSQQQATVASATTSGTTSAAAPTPPDVKAKDAEIQRLKDELAKANDELERIKRRLTAPTKP